MPERLGLYKIILWIAVFYGLFSFLSSVYRYFFVKTPTKKLINIDIILIIKNQEQIIENIIRSVAETITFGDNNSTILNLIVIDDYSTDQTPEILRILAEKYNFLKVIRMGKIQDERSPLEVGISICEGEVICILDTNSRLAPDRIKNVIFYLVDRGKAKYLDENVEIRYNPRGKIGLKT
ncbi:MAG TPA: glycosyltransferase [Thermoanaerobacterales bacterium]|nr:glycosyltransferase [Thermoanaerobacterales bacterium]